MPTIAANLSHKNVAGLTLKRIGRGKNWSRRKACLDVAKPVLIGFLILTVALFSIWMLTSRMDVTTTLNPAVIDDVPQRRSGVERWTIFNEGVRTTGTFLTAIAFVFGLFQWKAARREASFERYYDRLKIANDSFDDYKEEELTNTARNEEMKTHRFFMFLFAELDNLEYILQKHCLGYVDQILVDRALQHFWARCMDANIGKDLKAAILSRFGEDGCKEWAGYLPLTRKAASFLANSSELPMNKR